MSPHDLREKFPQLFKTTISGGDVAPVLGMSKSAVYAAIRDDKFPFPVLRIGGRIVIPTAPIREALGLDTLPTDDQPREVA